MARLPFMGGGKERQVADLEFERHKAEALGFRVPPPDPLEAQLTYIASDRDKFADESLVGELRRLHPDMDDAEIQSLVGRVLSIRCPKPETLK